MRRKLLPAPLAVLCVVSFLLSGCLCGQLLDKVSSGAAPSRPGSSPLASPAATGRDTPPEPFPVAPVVANRPLTEPRVLNTGKLEVGASRPLGTIRVDAAGGFFTLEEPGLPVTGMAINVPAGAYARPVEFKLTWAPITGNTFRNVNPLTPLITIDNGGGYAGKVLSV